MGEEALIGAGTVSMRLLSCARKLAISLTVVVSLGGCVNSILPPSFDEQAESLHRFTSSPAARYAVVSRSTNMHTAPLMAVDEQIATAIATIVTSELGIAAVALSHADGSPWMNELKRANEATGWIRMSDNRDFFRESDFDGYVLITMNESMEYYDFPREPGSKRTFFTYDPVFHIVALPPREDGVVLMQAGLEGRFSCEAEGNRLKDEAECVATFAKRFRRGLDARLDRADVNQRD